MFDVGAAEFVVLAIVAIFIFGPDKLPDVARQAGKVLRSARTMLVNARSQLSDELGPDFANVDLRDLNARSLVQKHLLGDLDEDPPMRAGHRPLEDGEQPPFDIEAT